MNLIIKGFIIGIGKIIPGVSGAMLAIILGEYEKIIKTISNIKNTNIEQMKYLTKIAIGIILAITLTSKIIVKSLNTHYFTTMLLFIGMIIGGIPNVIKQIKINYKDIIISIIFILITMMPIKELTQTQNHTIEQTIIEFTKLIGIGSLDALSSIIPGISGTALLMIFGYYDIILKTFATTLNPLYIKQNIFILLPFTIGFIIGILVISKIICILLKKQKNKLNITITIFMIITTIILTKKTIETNPTIQEIILGIILGIFGIIVTIKLENKNNNMNKTNNKNNNKKQTYN